MKIEVVAAGVAAEYLGRNRCEGGQQNDRGTDERAHAGRIPSQRPGDLGRSA